MTSVMPAAARPVHPSRTLVAMLVGASLASSIVTLFAPHLLTGPPAMNGSAKGTALVVGLGGAPALAIAYRRARRGSLAALTVAAGAATFLVYNGVSWSSRPRSTAGSRSTRRCSASVPGPWWA